MRQWGGVYNAFIDGLHLVAQILRNRRFSIFRLIVGDGELNLRSEVFHWIQRLSDDLYRLSTQIGEKCQSHEQQNGSQSWWANNVLQLLHAEQTVIATGIEHLIAHKRCQEFSHGYRTPNHDECQTEEPFQQIHFVGSHEL